MMGAAMDKDGRMFAAARDCTRRGWRVVPVRPRGKGVTLSGWQHLRLEEKDLRRWFSGTNRHNIGILTGGPSGGLVDVDCDAPEARAAAKELLPPTGLISGRASSPASHYWYEIRALEVLNLGDMSTEIIGDPTIPATEKFVDVGAALSPYPLPDAGRGTEATIVASGSGSGSPPSSGDRAANHHTTMLIELRSTRCQTVVPPSVHPSGETVRWETDGVPWSVGGAELRRAVAKVAAVAILARHWPGEGQRDEAAKDLAGLLLRGGWQEEAVDDFIRLVARIAGDEEWRRRGKAHGTARKLAAGDEVTGGPSLAGRLTGNVGDGERVVAQVRAWLGLSGAGGLGSAQAIEGRQTLDGHHNGELAAFAQDGELRAPEPAHQAATIKEAPTATSPSERCPVTGGPHEYGAYRDAQGRLLCVECEQPRPGPLPQPLP